MDDYINRQAAIDLVRDVCDAVMSGCESWYDPETEDEVYKDIREVDAILKCNKEVRIALRNMPSAQPDVPESCVGNMISRQAAIDTVRSYYDECDEREESIEERIERLPSADAIEVVRCEQCKHYNSIDFHCYYHGSMCFKPNDYCPYGEVRDDG